MLSMPESRSNLAWVQQVQYFVPARLDFWSINDTKLEISSCDIVKDLKEVLSWYFWGEMVYLPGEKVD